jgi:PAS domain S-box-containing protein
MSTQTGENTKNGAQQNSLQQGEERFRALIQYSADAIVLIAEDGTITYASESIQTVLGYTPAECVGTTIFSYLHPDDTDNIVEKLASVMEAPGTQVTVEYRARHKKGSWLWLEATGSNYLHDPLIRAIIGNFRNITEHKQIEFALQKEKERQRLLNEASTVLVSSLDHQFTLEEIARLIVPALADYCRIALLDDQGKVKEITVNHIDQEKMTLVRALYEEYKDLPNITHGLRKLLESGQPELISDVSGSVLQSVQGNSEILHIIRTLGLKSYMGIPLIARDRVIGALTFSSVQAQRHYTQEDFFFAQELARRIAFMLDNARLYQEAQEEIAERRQIEQNLRFLSEASKLLASSLDYHTTLTHVTYLAVPHIADWCSVDMRTEEGIQQLVVAHVDPEKVKWAKELNQKNPPDPQALTGLPNVLRTGKAEFYPEISDSLLVASARNEEELTLARTIGFSSVMTVPLLIQGEAIGAITFVTSESGRHYTQADLSMAEELASRAALAIQNARLYSEAQKAIGIRDDFISIASHELRTPITTLKMYTQVLQKQQSKKSEVDGSLTHALARMDAQLNKLNGLISDLLNVSKIELGRLEFQEEWFNLDEVVREACEAIQQTTTKHTIRIEGSITCPVWGDKDRVGQVVTNLLTNAIKYSPQAHEVFVQMHSEQEAAVVSVQDFGIGIDDEHLSKIFTRFYRVSDPEEKTFPGLGIGLYLSLEIIKRHSGNLTVASEKGKGSVFSFSLPINGSTPPTHTA